jgi:sorting nexin-5/6/32
VKYTVHTNTTLADFAKPETSVVREHEEFLWLHACLDENPAYAGFIVAFAKHGIREVMGL